MINMDGLFEYKNLAGEVKDIDVKKRIVTGYLSAFDNEDLTKDIIEFGAFKKSINERKENIYFLNQHDWKQPHGKFNVLLEDNKGLYFESNPLIDTTYSSDLMKLYEAGIVNEHSIGYQTVLSERNEKTGIRRIKEIKLFEGSNVTRGANPETPFTGMKSLTIQEINDKTNKILKAIKSGTFTDETFALLEVALKQYQLEAYNLGLNNHLEPNKITLEPKKDYIKDIREFQKLNFK